MFLTLLSAFSLILSFPKFSLWPLAWIAFVPVFYAARREQKFGGVFLHFYLMGFIFFFFSVEWLRHVSYFGWIFVATKYALYFGVFGLIVHWFWKRNHFFLSLIALPSIWVVLEWMRAEVPVWGFGWNLLSYSHSFNLDISGIASIIGAYGLSWLIMFANLSIFFILDFELSHRKSDGIIAITGILGLALVFGIYFAYDLKPEINSKGPNIRAVIVQGNIPQAQKWDYAHKIPILKTHEALSRLGAGKEVADLIIWPEAAYPGFYNVDQEKMRMHNLADELKSPILFGGLDVEGAGSNVEHYFNSAFLILPNEHEETRYDKIRLVSFGEYVPWRTFFNLFGLERLAYSLGVSDFEPGRDIKAFSIKEIKFSTLICFEDTFPSMALKAVKGGAQFLVVITNDAWFSKSAAPYQHLQASIFRAIENGVPLIRSANTGVSAVIASNGKVLDEVKDKSGNTTFIAGVLSRSVSLNQGTTFYQSKGYLLPYFFLGLSLLSFMTAMIWNHK